MIRPRLLLLALALVMLPAAPLVPRAQAADAAAGALLAQRWCAACHAIGPDARSAQSDAPTFPAIAAREKDMTGPWLAFRLLGPHPQMAPISVSRAEAADLAAYFAQLRN